MIVDWDTSNSCSINTKLDEYSNMIEHQFLKFLQNGDNKYEEKYDVHYHQGDGELRTSIVVEEAEMSRKKTCDLRTLNSNLSLDNQLSPLIHHQETKAKEPNNLESNSIDTSSQSQTYAECFHIARQYEIEKKYDLAIQQYQSIAFGNINKCSDFELKESLFKLGFFHQNGLGIVDSKLDQAMMFYTMSAEMGHPRAQSILGQLFFYGHLTATEQQKSISTKDFEKNKGSNCKEDDDDDLYRIEINYAKAAGWFRKASMNGHVASLYNLGICYEQGKGIEKNTSLALTCYKNAAAKGHLKAANRLNKCLNGELESDKVI